MIFDLFKPKPSVTGTVNSTLTGIKPTVLLILDGWGIAPPSEGNAITSAKTPNINWLNANFPRGELLAAGESVGLPANEVGNTEVGHINMGAGRLILQELKRISKAIEEGTFYDNRALRSAIDHAKKNNSKLHVLGMVGTGRVHSSIDHFWAIIETCRRQEFNRVVFHIFTDGRDTAPDEAKTLLPEIEEKIKAGGVGKIATISGRYWAMDRDRRWDRIEKAYKAIVSGVGVSEDSVISAIEHSYAKGKTDEFIEPVVIMENGKPVATVDDNDAAIFFNFRIDRPRQLTLAFVLQDFENSSFIFGNAKDRESEVKKVGATFKRDKVPKNLFFVTMTQYQKDLPVSAVAFPPEQIPQTLGEVVSAANLLQLHLTESEKTRFITYYFDGLHEERFKGEDVLIVPSAKVATYDKKPEMSVAGIVEEFLQTAGKYHFYVINIANPDMVAHTGNLKASITAIEHVDRAIGEIIKKVLELDGTIVITADHGNAEELITYPTNTYFFTSAKGVVNTDHSSNPVPVYVVNKTLQGKPNKLPNGTLADVAPTILKLMNLEIPPVMTGRNLLELK